MKKRTKMSCPIKQPQAALHTLGLLL